jgi:hypothetical protein
MQPGKVLGEEIGRWRPGMSVCERGNSHHSRRDWFFLNPHADTSAQSADYEFYIKTQYSNRNHQ